MQKRVAEPQKRDAIDTGVTIQTITADLTDLVKEASDLPQSSRTLNARRTPMDIATLNGLVVNP